MLLEGGGEGQSSQPIRSGRPYLAPLSVGAGRPAGSVTWHLWRKDHRQGEPSLVSHPRVMVFLPLFDSWRTSALFRIVCPFLPQVALRV